MTIARMRKEKAAVPPMLIWHTMSMTLINQPIYNSTVHRNMLMSPLWEWHTDKCTSVALPWGVERARYNQMQTGTVSMDTLRVALVRGTEHL